MDPQDTKAVVRRQLIRSRNALSAAERMELGLRIAEGLIVCGTMAAARTVLIYHTYRSEVPTEPLLVALAESGKRISLPHMTTGRRALVAAEYAPGDPLEPGPYGVPQPVVLHPIPAAELDVIVVPGVGFDRMGGRMGYGKGYYDRFLADPDLRAWVVGVGYELQVVERLPMEPHDRRMDALATEAGVIDCGFQ